MSAAIVGFQITLGAIEFFLIVICCLCVVLVILFVRYRKAILANEVLGNKAGEAKNFDYPGYSVEDYAMETRKTREMGGVKVEQTSNAGSAEEVRGMQSNKTLHIVGEDRRQEAKDKHYATRTRIIGGDNSRHEAKDHNGDIRFALDKFSSDNCEVSNREGDFEIGSHDSAL